MDRLRSLLALFLITLAAAAAGCGGGGGGDPIPADASLLSGGYFIWLVTATDDTPDEGGTLWGDLAADGAGGLTGSASQNANSVVTGPNAVTGTYTIAGDRQSTLTFAGTIGLAGWTNAPGTLALTGNVTALTDPMAVALVKLGSGFSAASLTGDYHVCGFSGGSTSVSYYGSATFDGAGAVTLTASINAEGTIGGGTPQANSYVVAPDGRFTYTFGLGGDAMEGCILPGGELALMAGSTDNGGPNGVFAFVKKTAGASLANFSGTYQLIGIERSGGGFASLTGSAVADGSGGLLTTLTKNTDGTLSATGPEASTYGVGGDGALTINPVGDPLVGGVSSSGNHAILGGPNTGSSEPGFYILMRR